MNYFQAAAWALAWITILAGCWLGWQLLRQNGRLLLRIESLEERLNELEFAEDEDPANRFSKQDVAVGVEPILALIAGIASHALS